MTTNSDRATQAPGGLKARFADPAAIRRALVNDQNGTMPTRTVRAHLGDEHLGDPRIGHAGAGSDGADDRPGARLGEVMVPDRDGDDVPLTTFCDRSETTGMIVIHRGRIVHSDYRHGFGPGDRHVMASISKSVFSLVLAPMLADGTIDGTRLIGDYVPELAGTGFGRARIDEAFHMLTTIRYGDRPFHKETEARAFFVAVGMVAAPDGYAGPRTLLDRLASAREDAPSGRTFRYENGNTEALGEVMRRATGSTIAELLETQVHSRIGASQDAHYGIDPTGRELVSGRFSSTLGDLAAIGAMMAGHGAVGDDQILPADLVSEFWTVPDGPAGDVLGSSDARVSGKPVIAYRRGWWLPLDGEGALVARGRSGQRLYINPGRQTIIAHVGAHVVDGIRPEPHYEPVFARISAALGDRVD